MDLTRKAGILLPVASLPSEHGIGDFGKSSYRFVDMLSSGGFSLWQILPLNPLGYGHSPYQPFSSFAMDELYLSLEDLKKEGLLGEIAKFNAKEGKIDYEGAREHKLPYLKEAFLADKGSASDIKEFVSSHSWVKLYAAFKMFKDSHNGASWDSWEASERDYPLHPTAFKGEKKKEYDFQIWLQFKLYQQWDKLHAYASSKGIKIIGDLPFYVGYDSCDVWASRDSFLLDSVTLEPTFIAGVPPDYFSETGQRWGNPIYDWEKLEKEDFAFIENRIELNAKIYDILRLDHFRAFDTYWKIPSSCPTAIDGEWVEAPGYKLFDSLFSKFPNLDIIAEDLGDLRPEVLTLRDHYSFPGMNVIEFTFDMAEIKHMDGFDAENSVAYLGTHDNDTMLSYFYELPELDQAKWVLALQEKGIDGGTMVDRLIRYCLNKRAKFAILSMQDILELDVDARTNVPGTVDDRNWTWKLISFKDFQAALPHLAILLNVSGRSALPL